jgi:hypothetical protein
MKTFFISSLTAISFLVVLGVRIWARHGPLSFEILAILLLCSNRTTSHRRDTNTKSCRDSKPIDVLENNGRETDNHDVEYAAPRQESHHQYPRTLTWND